MQEPNPMHPQQTNQMQQIPATVERCTTERCRGNARGRNETWGVDRGVLCEVSRWNVECENGGNGLETKKGARGTETAGKHIAGGGSEACT